MNRRQEPGRAWSPIRAADIILQCQSWSLLPLSPYDSNGARHPREELRLRSAYGLSLARTRCPKAAVQLQNSAAGALVDLKMTAGQSQRTLNDVIGSAVLQLRGHIVQFNLHREHDRSQPSTVYSHRQQLAPRGHSSGQRAGRNARAPCSKSIVWSAQRAETRSRAPGSRRGSKYRS